MPKHDYTPRQALDLLLKSIGERSPALAERIRVAIDAGKEVQVIDDNASYRRGRKKEPRFYRKQLPFTDEEALSAAIEVVEAHLIEVRRFAHSANVEFAAAGTGPPRALEANAIEEEKIKPEMVGERKELEIEVEPETTQTKRQAANIRLSPSDPAELASLQEILERLGVLIDFTE